MELKMRILTKTEASSLSRLYEKMQKADCGTISAFRANLTRKENQIRSRQLKTLLADPKLDITIVDGICLENYQKEDERQSREITFFVTKATPDTKVDIKSILVNLGKKFDQDFILWIPKKGDYAIAIGTNETGWPGLNQTEIFSKRSLGQGNQFMTKVSNRPFCFLSCETQSICVSPKTMQFVLRDQQKSIYEFEPLISNQLTFWKS